MTDKRTLNLWQKRTNFGFRTQLSSVWQIFLFIKPLFSSWIQNSLLFVRQLSPVRRQALLISLSMVDNFPSVGKLPLIQKATHSGLVWYNFLRFNVRLCLPEHLQWQMVWTKPWVICIQIGLCYFSTCQCLSSRSRIAAYTPFFLIKMSAVY